MDNSSGTPVSSWLVTDWTQSARVVLESELGLTPARLRGIAEAKYPLIVFVDDDNVLDTKYLETGLLLMSKYPNLGVIGGSTEGEFEIDAPSWFTQREFEMLGIRPISRSFWGNEAGNWRIAPIGAGMVIRNKIAKEYASRTKTDEQRLQLDRRGDSLVSGGDDDLASTALDLGYGIGRFAELRLLHLIPKERMTVEYLSRLAEGIGYSGRILSLIKSDTNRGAAKRWFMRITWLRPWIVKVRRPSPLKRIDNSLLAGERRAEGEWLQKNGG